MLQSAVTKIFKRKNCSLKIVVRRDYPVYCLPQQKIEQIISVSLFFVSLTHRVNIEPFYY